MRVGGNAVCVPDGSADDSKFIYLMALMRHGQVTPSCQNPSVNSIVAMRLLY